MTKMFGGLAMIDVMSICVLTLLIVALGGSSSTKQIRKSGKRRFSTELTVIAARVLPDDQLSTPQKLSSTIKVRQPLIGIELIQRGKVISTIDPSRGILSKREQPGESRIVLNIPPSSDVVSAVHLFVRDRGTVDILRSKIEVTVTNLRGLNENAVIPPLSASDYSWTIPMSRPDLVDTLVIKPDRVGESERGRQ